MILNMNKVITMQVSSFNWQDSKAYEHLQDQRYSVSHQSEGEGESRNLEFHVPFLNAPAKNAAKQDSAGAVCNSGMNMLFLLYSIFGWNVKNIFFWEGGMGFKKKFFGGG